MITSQRFIVMMILLNIMIGIMIDSYYNPQNPIFTKLTSSVNEFGTPEQDIKNDETWYDGQKSASLSADITIFDNIRFGMNLMGYFISQLIPHIGAQDDYDLEGFEIPIYYGITVLRMFLVLLAFMEVYLFIINRKGT